MLVPDQNGEATHNSLCADTTQGNAETYLTTDVVNWAKKMLPWPNWPACGRWAGSRKAAPAPRSSSRATPTSTARCCPVDGELKPTNGSVAKMVQEYFAGDRKAYDEQVPVNAIAATGTPEQALFTGAGDGTRNRLATCARSPTPRAKPAWRSPS